MLVATSNFLVPNGTFIAELIAFLIVVGVLAKWVLPPLNKAMEHRQEEIRNSLETADRARAEAAQAVQLNQQAIEDARKKARSIVAQASQVADQLRAEAAERAQQEYDRILASAETEISLARQRAVDELTQAVADLVMTAAERVVGEELDARRHQALIDEVIASVRAGA
ncbi:MAG: F0F1 ATP synthase subunit B [Actinobacteria bacterium]|nr:F0F1 ATP synthase subunit B [Actinomycetota bacterium]